MNRNDKQVDNEIIIYHPAIKHFFIPIYLAYNPHIRNSII